MTVIGLAAAIFPWVILYSKLETSSRLADQAVPERASCAEARIARSCLDALMAKPPSLEFAHVTVLRSVSERKRGWGCARCNE